MGGHLHHIGGPVQPTSKMPVVDEDEQTESLPGQTMENNTTSLLPEETPMSQKNPSIAISMSRYRRNRPNVSGSSAAPAIPQYKKIQSAVQSPVQSPMQPPVQPSVQRPIQPSVQRPVQSSVQRPVQSPVQGPVQAPVHLPPSLPTNIPQMFATEMDQVHERHRQNAMEQLTGGSQMVRPVAVRPAGVEKEAWWKRDLGSDEPLRVQTHKTTPSERERRADATPSLDDRPRKSFLQKVKLAKTKEPADVRDEPMPRYIGVGGGGIVPGTDAPLSAVNARDRQVRVRYGETAADLTVTPFTQVHDLLLAASQTIFRDVDPGKFILIESFRSLGLERPLRRYERIRDIMNSWAHDTDNHLIIIPPSGLDALAQVDPQQVPAEQPREKKVCLYHSQRSRKWDKRFITLRPDGQVVMAKKENSKDHTRICHLSDYDIYSASARALANDIKPPKKLCFAIKSQQKHSMFLSPENFVHYFSTSDRSLADEWYRAVQGWRSWYMVNKLGANQAPGTETLLGGWPVTSPPDSISRREHLPSPTLGLRALTIDTKVVAPAANKGPLVQGISPEEIDAATFSPSGLLGHTYAQRRQAMRDREEREKRAQQDPFSAQGLLGGGMASSAAMQKRSDVDAWLHGMESASLPRRGHIGQRYKPLVDLTPVFREPPQHARKGRGVTVESGPLIDAATGPPLAPGAVAIPSATALRRPSVETALPVRTRANTMHGVRHAPPPLGYSGSYSAGSSPVATGVPFTPNSLLANYPQGHETLGHGVATGDRTARRPLLDMSAESPFAEGSLLRRL